MSDEIRQKMLSAYVEKSPHNYGFFTQFFQTPQENFHSSHEVTIDVVRSGSKVAPVLVELGAGLNRSENRKFVNHKYAVPPYGEEFVISTVDLLKRQPGYNPFQDVGFMTALQEIFESEMRTREEMIRRAIELQASQLLRTGKLTLPGVGGAVGFELDYKPKTALHGGASTDWDENTGVDVIKDLRSLANAISQNSGTRVVRAICGSSALERLLKDPDILLQTKADGTRIGEQVPPDGSRVQGGIYHGRISVGSHRIELWSTDGFYESLSNGSKTPYIGEWEIVLMGENIRLDLTFGDIPNIIPVDPRLSGLSVGRASSPGRKIDLITNAWFSPNGRYIYGSVESRPLCIPTQIDGFGSLNCKVS